MLAIALAALALALLAAIAFWYRTPLLRRWRLRGGRSRPRYPVVLVHGIMGFDAIKVGQDSHAYFRGVRERLEAAGVVVHSVSLPKIASVAARARALADFVRALPARKVNLIGHSMGGLDARFAIAELGLADRVASLITVGTPHRGTPIADVGSGVLDRVGARWLAERAGLPADGLVDLTSKAASAFNSKVADQRRVFYGCVVAAASERTHPLLAPTHLWLRKRSGDNDGLVPRDSQIWGEVLADIDADHWASVGWSSGFDAPGLYASLARELCARGF